MGRTWAWALPALALGISLACAVGARAAEGVVEINSACVINGCFPGDTPGFPVTITGEAGLSYQLTDNLTLGTVDTTGIFITGTYITIDLSGHRITGPVTCEGSTTKCDGLGTGDGIAVENSFDNLGVTVRNGTVQGAGRHGLNLGGEALVEAVHAVSNGEDGIHTGTGAVIRHSFGMRNGDQGIEVSTSSLVIETVAFSNVDDGIYAAGGTTVSHCNATDNQDNGIVGLAGVLVENSTLVQNTNDGILLTMASSGYRGNVIFSGGGTVSGGTDLGANLCDGGACP